MRYVSAGIVVVSIQYRLGVIGFSSTGNKQMAGNFGLWDQFAALEFVSENIAQFGGNPADITLFGESAGAASVSFLGLSPHSQGLFQKCVQLSGSPLSAWALNGRVINETDQLAAAIGCAENGREGIKECLKRKTVDELFEGVEKVGKTRQEYDFTKWGPLLDGDFLPADIPQLIERAPPKPTVIGIADLETLLWTLAIGHNDSISLYAIPWEEMANFDRRRFEMFVQNFVAKRELFGQQMATELQREIVQFYTRDKAVERIENAGEYYLRKITLLLSDLQFAVPVIWEATQKAQKGWPIYFFKNTYFNEVILPKVVKVRQNFHANDFIYFFDRKVYRFEFNANDKLISNFLMETVINFVKTGNPSSDHSTVQWLPLAPKDSSESFVHLLIEMPMPKMNPKMEEEIGRAQFWTQMRTKHPKIDLIRGQF
ncbi:hypothetical protein niasHT_025328 [Heterodera trifolii]|uniref:Carboxylic ester hydrolase n=1 Tax=Heterodera trifolii TaxID=157864 RepID=A0ABD2KKL0_9BILA